MTTPAPARSNYLDLDELRALVKDYRRRKRASDALGRALASIAGGVWDRYRFTADREEFVQEVTLHLLQRPLEKADVQKHLFNFFTTCAIRYGHKLRDKANGDRRRFETFARECLDAGRPVVEDVVGRRGEDLDQLDRLVSLEERAEDKAEVEDFFRWLEAFRDTVERELAAAAPIPTLEAPRRRRRVNRSTRATNSGKQR